MPALLVVCVGVVQFLGLVSLGWAKMSEGASSQSLAQIIFFFSLLLVAGTAAISVSLGSALWPVCAVTCGVMVVGATMSSRREFQAIV